jgi:hypothetical protein
MKGPSLQSPNFRCTPQCPKLTLRNESARLERAVINIAI